MKLHFLVITALAVVTSASAETFSQTIEFDHTHSTVSGSLVPLTFGQFDPSLGNLLSVSLTTTGSFARTVGVVVNGSFGSGNYILEIDGNMQTSGVGLTLNRIQDFTINGSGPNGTIPVTYNRTFGGFNSIAATAQHIGTGTFNLNTQFIGTETYRASAFSSPSPAQFISQTTTGEATLTYTYEAVPEPATLGIIGLATMAAIRRKSKKQ